MAHRAFSALAVALTLSLAACGGGGGGGTVPVNGPTAAPGSVIISPFSLAFSGPGAPSQTFTVSSSLGNVAGVPQIDTLGCAPVVSIATASTSLPATYTVTPTGNGSCTFVATVNHQSSAIGITVGNQTSRDVSAPGDTVNLFVGGTSGFVVVTAISGTLVPDTSACAGIATIGGSSGPSPREFTISPVGVGSCTLTVADGASWVAIHIVVNPNPNGGNALFITPSTATFASQSSPTQQATLSFSGNAGNVSIDESDCIGQTGKGKIAFVTIGTPGQAVSLPATVTISPYGPTDGVAGTCTIRFTSSAGATPATLTVTVQTR